MPQSTFYKLGRLTGGKVRKAKWMWHSLAGDEPEAIEAEYGVGRDMAAVVRERSGVDDPALATLLDDTLGHLTPVVRNKLHRFHVGLVDEPEPTAYALPGGFIFVTSSLTNLCERNHDELAFVVAHEMSHVIRRHAINRVLRQTAYAAASVLTPGRGAIGPWLRKAGLEWLERAYSQDQEFEADALGGLMMRAAGYDPEGAIRLFERFRALGPLGGDEDTLGTYLSPHPPVNERIARLRKRLSKKTTS